MRTARFMTVSGGIPCIFGGGLPNPPLENLPINFHIYDNLSTMFQFIANRCDESYDYFIHLQFTSQVSVKFDCKCVSIILLILGKKARKYSSRICTVHFWFLGGVGYPRGQGILWVRVFVGFGYPREGRVSRGRSQPQPP